MPVPPRWMSGSFAVAAVAAFLWMELAHPEPNDTRLMGWLIFSYTILVLAGASLWGRKWLRESEGFAVLFNMIGAMGSFLRREGPGIRRDKPSIRRDKPSIRRAKQLA